MNRTFFRGPTDHMDEYLTDEWKIPTLLFLSWEWDSSSSIIIILGMSRRNTCHCPHYTTTEPANKRTCTIATQTTKYYSQATLSWDCGVSGQWSFTILVCTSLHSSTFRCWSGPRFKSPWRGFPSSVTVLSFIPLPHQNGENKEWGDHISVIHSWPALYQHSYIFIYILFWSHPLCFVLFHVLLYCNNNNCRCKRESLPASYSFQ